MATPIARYRLNEAASGQSPTHVLDSIASPTNLEISYVGSVPSYTEIASGRGLSFPSQSSPQGAGAYSVRLEPGVKVYDALEGSTAATITVVADLVTLSSYNGINPCNIFGIARWDGEYDALLVWIWDDVLWFDWTGSGGDPTAYYARSYDLDDIGAGLHVITAVLDTTEASEPNRMRLYCDGELLTPVGGEGTVPQNQTIHIQLDASTPDFLTPAGNRYDCLLSLGSYEDYLAGNGGFLGSIYYADLYDVALSASEVEDAATALIADNDNEDEVIMATYNKFNAFVENVAEGVFNLGTNQLAVALCAAANAPVAGNSVLADLTQISYTNLSSRNITTTSSSQTGGTYSLVLEDLTLTASGGSVGPFRYVVIYSDTPTSPADPLIAWYDYGSDLTLADGESLTIDFGANLLTLA